MAFSSFLKFLAMATLLMVQVNAEPSQQTRNLRIQSDDLPQEQARRLGPNWKALVINVKNNPGVSDGVMKLLKKADLITGTSKKIKEKVKDAAEKVKNSAGKVKDKVTGN
ncbi:hypothetical protein DVH05_028328 [Phytophthora capsici]|nr:hypothetical protein DVH05_007659 [Phytophthora capsici]KAG1685827.1 hypothetical protein DVH05_007663 [Phytophthora capsici]KAG1690245.1 hypothetical protein DVH05_028319 [Phytophthora capsici]KAG1690250.1 hypothetical protein DVH05_028324 [Phytophthora capsici]KAG1690254.1 hypothetical protein DVH05_028328 [Phytophthora capsici]